MADCLAATAAGCDGCFIDRSNNMTQLNMSAHGAMSPADSLRFEQAHLATLTELNAKLLAAGKFAISNNEGSLKLGTTTMMIEDFAASGHCVETLLEAVRNNLTVQAHAGNYADEGPMDGIATKPGNNCNHGITNSLAAYLVAAGRYTYYHCATGWQSNPMWPEESDDWLAWRPEYDHPLGDPLGDAIKAGDVYTRTFKSGTRVLFDGRRGNGTILWGDGTQQAGRPWNPPAANSGCKWQTIGS